MNSSRFGLECFLVAVVGVLLLVAIGVGSMEEGNYCVADLDSGVRMSKGYVCKPEEEVRGSDFVFRGLRKEGDTKKGGGLAVSPGDVQHYPGLNGLGVSINRVDYAARGGENGPHTHPRASELLFVLYGTLYVGFVDTNNKVWSSKVQAGDLFMNPRGLIHFQYNFGDSPASILAIFNHENPGIQRVSHSLFASSPSILDPVLQNDFHLHPSQIHRIRSILLQQFNHTNHV